MRFLSAMLLVCLSASATCAGEWGAIPSNNYTVSVPIGWYDFCKQAVHYTDCNTKTPDTQPLHIDKKIWALLVSVNKDVNRRVVPMEDIKTYGKDEVWAYPGKNMEGDCEDYALLKRRILNSKGLPLGDLLITVTGKQDGEGHAVLIVHSDTGDFVLDNLQGEIHRWYDTPYKYLKRQSSDDPSRWVALQDARTSVTASVE